MPKIYLLPGKKINPYIFGEISLNFTDLKLENTFGNDAYFIKGDIIHLLQDNKVDKNNKYDRKTIQLKTESLKLLIKDAKKLNDEIGSEQREKALKKLDEALESLGKVPNE